jgi:TRAP-type uncharacterized transport system fused permease subunit
MAERWQPGKSAMAAAIITVFVGLLHPETRPTLRRLVQELHETGRIILDLLVITAAAGLIIGLLQLTGLAFNISLLLTEAAGGSLLILLLMTGLVCIVLGMGMPSAVIYIVLSVIAAPALVEAGVVKMSAHMFLFYFGMLSMITPPVCLATIAAASVAGTPIWKTGWAGVQLGFIAYVVPFVFVYQPELVFEGGGLAILAVFGKSVLGVTILCFSVSGFLFERLATAERILLAAAGGAILLAPIGSATGIGIAGAGAIVVGIVIWRLRRQSARVPA